MNRKLLGGLILFFCLSFFISPASAVSIPLADDSFVSTWNSLTNYGSYSEVELRHEYYYGSYIDSYVYLKFDLSSVPDNAVVTSASLGLTTKFNSNFAINNVLHFGLFHVSDDAWTENTITGNNAPPADPELLGTSTPRQYQVSSFDLLQSGDWDYDADLQDDYASFLVRYHSGGQDPRWVRFYSSEGSVSSAPFLELEYSTTTVPIPSALLLLASGLLGLAGIRRSSRMKSRTAIFLLAALLAGGVVCALPGQADCAVISLEVEAWIDGRSHLVIQGDSLQWVHHDWTRPGLEWTESEPYPPFPTYVSTYVDGVNIMDRVEWEPVWPDGQEFGPGSSAIWTGLSPVMPSADLLSSDLVVVQARESLWVVQAPDVGNAYTTILEFDDNISGSADWYIARMDYTTVPIPGALVLLGSGLLGMAALAGRRRR